MSQKQLLEAAERLMGEKFETEFINSESFILEKKAAAAAGDGGATYALIETGFVTGKYGGYLEEEGDIMNDLLELPKPSFDEVVKAAVEAVKRT